MMAEKGMAGNHGPGIRSDCRIEIELLTSGGVDVGLESKVSTLYGDSIRTLAARVLDHFNVQHARVQIHDSGALDFVLAARLEAAIKQVRETAEDFLLPPLKKTASRAVRERFRLTRLYLPGNSPWLMINAGIHKPDGVILDLEDSVAPERKEEARLLVRNALAAIDFYGAERMVRINQLPMGLADLDAVLRGWPDLILVPKAEDPGQIREVEDHIRTLTAKTGIKKEMLLMPIIETALGVERAYDIASASENIVAMAIGLEDYAADMGVMRTEEGNESHYARSRMVNACKAAGIQAIDSVYSDVANQEGLRNTVRKSKAMGFEGMGCIHPRQVPVVQEAFRPDPAEIDKAVRIVRAFEEAEKKGLGVVSLGSKMIDPPVVKMAQHTISMAESMGILKGNWRKTYE
jgi:citrate lyase subunit beta/citryl-CoA lyase